IVFEDHRMAMVGSKKLSPRLQVAAKTRLLGKRHQPQTCYRPSSTVRMRGGQTPVRQSSVAVASIDRGNAMKRPGLLGELRDDALPAVRRPVEIDSKYSEVDVHATPRRCSSRMGWRFA